MDTKTPRKTISLTSLQLEILLAGIEELRDNISKEDIIDGWFASEDEFLEAYNDLHAQASVAQDEIENPPEFIEPEPHGQPTE